MQTSKKNVIMTLLLFFLMYMVSQVVATFAPDGFQNYAFYACLLAGTLIVAKKQEVPLPIKKPRKLSLLCCTFTLVCIYPMTMFWGNVGYFVANALSNGDTESSALYASQTIDTSGGVLITLLATSLIPAVVEELMTRGLVQGGCNKLSPFLGLVVSTVIFGALHVSIQVVPFAVFIGVVFGIIRGATGNLTYTIFMHFLFNAVNTLLIIYNLDFSITFGELSNLASFGMYFAAPFMVALILLERKR